MNSNPDPQLTICDLMSLNLSFLTMNIKMKTNKFVCRINEIISELLDERAQCMLDFKYSEMIAILILFEFGKW